MMSTIIRTTEHVATIHGVGCPWQLVHGAIYTATNQQETALQCNRCYPCPTERLWELGDWILCLTPSLNEIGDKLEVGD